MIIDHTYRINCW